MVVAVAVAMAKMAEEDAEDVEEVEEVAAEEAATIVSIWKQLNVSIVAKGSSFYRLLSTKKECQWEFKHGIQSGFQKNISIFFERHVDKKKNIQRRRKTLRAMMSLWTWMFF
jgi:dihydroxyacetone kinase